MTEEQQILEEKVSPIGVWWLSFCDSDRPTEAKFLGGCFVWARGPISAMKTSHMRGCNPGGAMLSSPVVMDVDAKWMNRLLSRQQISEMDVANERLDSDSDSPATDSPVTDRPV